MYGYMALVITYAILRANYLKASLLAVISKYYQYYNDYYGTSYIITGEKSGEYITEVFLLIAIFMSIIIGYIITCYMIRGLYFIVTLPWICLCYIAGLTGEGSNMLIYIVVTFALFCSGSVKDNYCVRNRINLRGNNYKQKNFKDIAAIKIGVSMMIIISVVILVASSVLPEREFNRDQKVSMIRYNLQYKIDKIFYGARDVANGNRSLKEVLNGKVGSVASGGISGGNLGDTEGLSFKNIAKYKVDISKTEDVIYLRGYIGNKYDRGWKYNEDKEVTEENKFYIGDYFPYLAVNIEKINKNTEDLVAVIHPDGYGILSNGRMDADYSISNGFYPINAKQLKKYWKKMYNDGYFDEIGYDINLREQYIKVPDEIAFTIRNVKDQIDFEYDIDDVIGEDVNMYSAKGIETTEKIIDAITNYFSKNYTYELMPGKVDKEKDPIEYFVNESRKGYCMYYAATATALFRAYGIPARYAEGYIITSEDYKASTMLSNGAELYKDHLALNMLKDKHVYEMTIKDSNAHAWTEIYIDGIGWIPVEVTSNTLDGNVINQESDFNDPDDETDPTPTPEPTVKPQEDNKPTVPPANNNKPVETKVEDKGANIVTVILICIIGAIIILFGAVYSLLMLRKTNKSNEFKAIKDKPDELIKYMSSGMKIIFEDNNIVLNNNTDYKEYAHDIAKNYKYIGELSWVEALEIIVKVRFSNESATKEECEEVIEIYNEFMEKEFDKLKKFKKLYCDNILCLKKKI